MFFHSVGDRSVSLSVICRSTVCASDFVDGVGSLVSRWSGFGFSEYMRSDVLDE